MAKLKHVFPRTQVAHEYFYNEQGISHCKEPGDRFSWKIDDREHGIFYSYRSPIGIAIPEKKIILIRTGTYSNTTSKHQYCLRYAVPDGWTRYLFSEWSYANDKSFNFCLGEDLYNAYFEIALQRLKENKNQLTRGIGYFGDPALDSFVYQDCVNFAKDLDCKKLLRKYDKQFKALEWSEEDMELYDIKYWAKQREIRGSIELKRRLYSNPEAFKEYQLKEAERNEKAKQKKIRENQNAFIEYLQRYTSMLEDWYVSESPVYFHSVFYDTAERFANRPKGNRYRYGADFGDKLIYLRLSPEKLIVQTSLGVEIPIAEAKRLYDFFYYCISIDKEWVRNGEKYKIAHKYDLAAIYKKENRWMLKAGCHDIRKEEIDEFVKRFVPEWKRN